MSSSIQDRFHKTAVHRTDPLGWPVYLMIFYLALEYVRPPNPLKLPLIISLIFFFWWATQKNKIWAPQLVCFYLLIATIAVMGPFAVNNFSIWTGFQSMVAWLICIATPMVQLANSLRKIRALVAALIVFHCYLAVHAIIANGVGPGGFVGDENDVALSINTFLPLAFFSSLTARTSRGKLFYWAAVVTMVAGVVASNSRGGFLGLVAVIAFCILFSPRRGLGFAIAALLLAIGSAFVPQHYWAEMATIAVDAESDVGTGAHRMRLWGVAVDMFAANPFFGVGLNNYRWNVGDYMSAELLEKEGRSYMGTVAHSLYFTVLSETGLVGSALFAAIVYFTLRDVRNVLRRTKAMEQGVDGKIHGDLLEIRGTAYGLCGGMVGYGVAGVFLTVFVYPHFWYVVALVVSLVKLTESLETTATRAKLAAAP